jgi:hypothetical protein
MRSIWTFRMACSPRPVRETSPCPLLTLRNGLCRFVSALLFLLSTRQASISSMSSSVPRPSTSRSAWPGCRCLRHLPPLLSAPIASAGRFVSCVLLSCELVLKRHTQFYVGIFSLSLIYSLTLALSLSLYLPVCLSVSFFCLCLSSLTARRRTWWSLSDSLPRSSALPCRHARCRAPSPFLPSTRTPTPRRHHRHHHRRRTHRRSHPWCLTGLGWGRQSSAQSEPRHADVWAARHLFVGCDGLIEVHSDMYAFTDTQTCTRIHQHTVASSHSRAQPNGCRAAACDRKE